MPDTPPSDLPLDPDAAPGRDVFRQGGARNRQWDHAVVIAAGGAVGGGGRYLINAAVPASPGGFPWSTFLENITGCLLLGALMVFLLEVWPTTRYGRPFLGVGVLGGFTTFSTYTVDTDALLRGGQAPLALTYMFATVTVGLIATWLGLNVARLVAGITNETRGTS